MKKLLKKIACFFTGHRWTFKEHDWNGHVCYYCSRCGKETQETIDEYKQNRARHTSKKKGN